ncbi:M20/M25/M40 family metallo-hydrolase [Arthrobacter woluwensis]|uniref:M20/M25/M40 family metallo-hydrolase n=1 Tax=Arthrobacter woluwensis TaxID=156980 RepID=UPI0037F8B4F5
MLQRSWEKAKEYFDSGEFFSDLARRVSYRTESFYSRTSLELNAYLDELLVPELEGMGFRTEVHRNWNASGNSFLVARRLEDPEAPTVLCYGHADVVAGMDDRWQDGRDPWTLSDENGVWYGRGTADNKGQHHVNLSAARILLQEHGSLGFNLIFLFECGEEIGSPALNEFVDAHRDSLAADVLIASDGPRIDAETPTLFLGNRGAFTFRLSADLREDSLHSGNWGGILRNAATTVAAAVESLVDGTGRLLIPALHAPDPSPETAAALARLEFKPSAEDPEPDPEWFDPDLTPAERLWGSNVLEVLALGAGDVDDPVNAIPGEASAVLQLRYVAGSDAESFAPAIRQWLAERGFGMVTVDVVNHFPASRIEVTDPWVPWAAAIMAEASGKPTAVLPNIGGSLPNAVFAATLGIPTLWVPHSYPGCRQHAANEHFLALIGDEGLRIMCALFHYLGHPGDHPAPAKRQALARSLS